MTRLDRVMNDWIDGSLSGNDMHSDLKQIIDLILDLILKP